MTHAEQESGTVPEEPGRGPKAERAQVSVIGFVVLWSPADPGHLGAWLPVSAGASESALVLGRGGAQAGETLRRVVAVRQRPGSNELLPVFQSQSLSREQLEIRATAAGSLDVKNLGRLELAVNGSTLDHAEVSLGDVVELGNQLALLCTERPAAMAEIGTSSFHPFGTPDEHGFVGESVAAWRLRSEVRFAARRADHVIFLGPSGTGKELVAAALHRASERTGPFVARNAATLPETLVDAELFGNLKGYPNPGMPERKGLIGAAHEGTLFLDEFADLPASAQAHLLRVLDQGEYQRLGDAETSRSAFRLVAATNRPVSSIRSDVLARFDFRIHVPPLDERREDIPLLLLHLLDRMVGSDAELGERLLTPNGLPNLSPAFVRRIVQRGFETNVRELRHLLWRAVSSSQGAVLEWPTDEESAESEAHANGIGAAELEKALEQHNGSIEKTWRSLGLSSRHALTRLLKKYGLKVTRQHGRR